MSGKITLLQNRPQLRLIFIFLALGLLACASPQADRVSNETRSAPAGAAKKTPKAPGVKRTPAAAQPGAASPGFSAPEISGRPSASSITINAVPQQAVELYYEYGIAAGTYISQTTPVSAAGGAPLETVINSLQANTRYFYRLRYRLDGTGEFASGEERSFMTQRAPGSTFTFGVQGDSHPERVNTQFNADLYTRSLLNAAASQPDFYLTIGDDFSVDQLATLTEATVSQLYLNQRQYLGLVGAPVFLVNGNHEQAALANLDGTPDNVAVWAQTARNAYYPQPAPDDFYGGDAQVMPYIGLLRDYYAWTWGDALFVVIDPYWHSTVAVDNRLDGEKNTRNLWDVTLDETQYQWFKQTLEQSDAKFKFVFAHHVSGTGRGGIELAGLYEWGGYDKNGSWLFDEKRPGWPLPLHQLMVQNGVTIFFQGHDHIFVKQELDGVIYQSMPEPADPNYSLFNADKYLSGVELPNSGYVRVTVSADQVLVEYVRAYLPQDEGGGQFNGQAAYSYTVGSATPSEAFPGTMILGSPTDRSVTLNVLPEQTVEAYLEYGPQAGIPVSQTITTSLQSGAPDQWTLAGLAADTRYFYRMRFRRAGEALFATDAEHSFTTQRRAGSTFTFDVTADPHNREPNFNGGVYAQTLQNVLDDQPDFLVDLGDTFMTEKLRASTYISVVQTMLDMRPYLSLAGAETPLYLVNGNHEGELGWLLDGDGDNLAVWSTQARQLYYPNPTPGGFYSGSATEEAWIGRRDGYYAWEWGDALFVVLDPFWYTLEKSRPGEENWGWTLGKEQYDWLAQTLSESQATFKFVFAHQLVGGTNDTLGVGRGGIEWAGFYEWGGQNLDGSWGFDAYRPGWGKPIHQLLVDNHVTIFFHGHDHLFVKQDLDGVVYQEAPQPSYTNYDNTNSAAEYGYLNGVLLGNTGHLRVTVSPGQVTVDYVRAYLPQDENSQRQNGAVSYSYTITAPQSRWVYLPMLCR